MSCHRLHAENKRKYIERKTMGRGRGELHVHRMGEKGRYIVKRDIRERERERERGRERERESGGYTCE